MSSHNLRMQKRRKKFRKQQITRQKAELQNKKSSNYATRINLKWSEYNKLYQLSFKMAENKIWTELTIYVAIFLSTIVAVTNFEFRYLWWINPRHDQIFTRNFLQILFWKLMSLRVFLNKNCIKSIFIVVLAKQQWYCKHIRVVLQTWKWKTWFQCNNFILICWEHFYRKLHQINFYVELA